MLASGSVSDTGRDLRFGLFPTPAADRLDGLLSLVDLAERAGLDLVSVQDHPYQQRFLDTWTLLSFLGARTQRIHLATNVASLPLRPPAVLATSAASLDVLTGGRVELGLGTGAFWDAIVAAGGPRRTPGQAVAALEEAIEVIRQCWQGGTVRVEGEHYRVAGFKAGPRPAHPIPIWVGAYQPRMLRLTGRLADAWVPSLGYAAPDALPAMVAVLDEAARRAGRAPADIERIYNIHGSFGTGAGLLAGRPQDWAEQLADLALQLGMTTFVLGTDDPTAVARFAAEVAPETRRIVADERGGDGVPAATSTTPTSTTPTSTTPTSTTPTGTTSTSTATSAPGATTTRPPGPAPWDEASRPTHEEPADAAYPLAAHAEHLVQVHDGLRAELTQVRDLLDQVRAGQVGVGQARSVINTMTLRQNNWTLGAYCEAYCRIVTGHHTLEDRGIFPHLRAAEPGLAPVIDRLEHEHEVIHEVLDGFDRALVGLVGDQQAGSAAVLDEVQRALDLLTDTLLSHLAYEERELLGPLGRHGLH